MVFFARNIMAYIKVCKKHAFTEQRTQQYKVAEREGFEPSIQNNPYDGLANRCLKPLGHLSTNNHLNQKLPPTSSQSSRNEGYFMKKSHEDRPQNLIK